MRIFTGEISDKESIDMVKGSDGVWKSRPQRKLKCDPFGITEINGEVYTVFIIDEVAEVYPNGQPERWKKLGPQK